LVQKDTSITTTQLGSLAKPMLYAALFVLCSFSGCICSGTNNSNADLESLTFSTGTLSPTFDKNTTEYTLKLHLDTTELTLTPTAVAGIWPLIRISITTSPRVYPVVSGNESTGITIEPGTSVLTVKVKSPDKKVEKSYNITITKAVTDEESLLRGSDTANSDEFGTSIAVSGDTMVVGAQQQGGVGNYIGAAYVFTRSGTTWVQEAKLTASDGAPDDLFGISVSIYGNTIAVGAQYESTTQNRSGAVYIYTRSGSTWTEQLKIKAPTIGADYYFGTSVAVYDGVLVVGEINHNSDYSGAIHIYEGSGSSWPYVTTLTASDAVANNMFGTSVAASAGTIVVGSDGNNNNTGAVYVITNSTGTWIERAILVAAGSYPFCYAGYSVAIYGTLIVIGAPGESTVANASGAFYMFAGSDATWVQQGTIFKANTPVADDYMGLSVAIDGNIIVAGAPGIATPPATGRGSVYVFMRNSSYSWIQAGDPVTAPDGVAGDNLGISVGIYGDRVVSGAYHHGLNDSGAVYTFY